MLKSVRMSFLSTSVPESQTFCRSAAQAGHRAVIEAVAETRVCAGPVLCYYGTGVKAQKVEANNFC